MTVQITIIGTGQIGASIGLALAEHKDMFLRVGHDKNIRIANQVKTMGALDRVDPNLLNSVANADIVILALPLDQIRETIQFVASDLKEDVVVMDTAPVKAEVMAWAKEMLPSNRHYIGLMPVLNPAYLDLAETGVEAARADLFKNGMMAILSPKNTPGEAIKLAMDFSTMVGAAHLFIDPLELDSMLAATRVLPQLVAAALLNITVDQPGWQDSRKLADRTYAIATRAITQSRDANSLYAEAVSANEHLVRWIDALMDNLVVLREQLSSKDGKNLLQFLAQASLGREKWLNEKKKANWAAENMPNVEIPTAKQVFSQMITFGAGRKPKKPK